MMGRSILPGFFLLFCCSVPFSACIRLDDSVIPYHYDIQLELNVESKSFSGQGSIEVELTKELRELRINRNYLVGSWTTCRLVSHVNDQAYLVGSSIYINDQANELLVLQFPATVPGGANYTLYFESITGTFDRALEETADLTSGRYVVTSGFESTGFRKLFPSFDQPEFKTTFKFTVTHPEEYSWVINTGTTTTEDIMDNKQKTIVSIEVPLSTTSIGFALTDMAKSSDTSERVIVHHHDDTVRENLLQIYSELFLAIEKELNLPNVIQKLSIVYSPNLTTPTLSKWGLIFVGPKLSPNIKSVLYSVELKAIKRDIARSIFEMYLNGVITANWWSNRWITQGLARYLSERNSEEFLLDTVHRVLTKDRNNIMGLVQEVSFIDQINNPNEIVVDHRAGATFRMIANIMGEDQFLPAVLEFLSANKFTAITSAQLISHLDKYCPEEFLPDGRRLTSVIAGYEIQGVSFYPNTVDVQSNEQQFIILKDVDNKAIDLPIDYMTARVSPLNQPREWIEPTFDKNVIRKFDNNDWIIVNPQQYGIYRVNYDDSVWSQIVKQFQKDHTKIPNRGQLIADSTSLVIDNKMTVGKHFDLILYLAKERDVWTWKVARKSFEDMKMFLRGITETGRLDFFYSLLVKDEYLKNPIGWTFVDFERTQEVAWIACLTGQITCLEDAEKYVGNSLDLGHSLLGSDDFQHMIYCTLARHSVKTQTWFVNILLKIQQNVNFSTIRNQIRGVGCTINKDVMEMFLDMAGADFLEVLNVRIAREDRLFIFQSFLFGSSDATFVALKFINGKYDKLNQIFVTMEDLFRGVGEFVRTDEQFALLQEILTAHQAKFTDLERDVLMNEVSVARTNRMSMADAWAEADAWLRDNVPITDLGNNLKALNAAILLAVVVVIREVML